MSEPPVPAGRTDESVFEPFAGSPTGWRRWRRDLGVEECANALIAFLFAATGPVAVVLTVGIGGGLSESELASWLFGAFFLNGLLSVAFCLLYRQPLVFFWTIPGTVLLGPALARMPFDDVIGAFVAAGLLMLLLGLSGWVRRLLRAVPMAIVMGMVAGVFLRFGTDLVLAVRDAWTLAVPMIVVFVLASAWPAAGRRLPPLLGALLVGVLLVVSGIGDSGPGALADLAPREATAADTWLAEPVVRVPEFAWAAMVELVVPLAITVLLVHNAQGVALLTAAGHAPPINALTTACGAATILTGMVGTAPTCLAGPTNALIAAGGARERHYAAGVAVGVLAIVFGLLAPLFTRLLLTTPPAFIATIAGLAMLKVLQSAFTSAFGSRCTLGALVGFLVTVAGVPLAGIGAPFWGLVFGFATSLLLERDEL